ncbi:hypothetical protein NEUTE1DRAFT_135779 [Neurospora tetrasperma FGSC 2508]|uniref:Gfd2/YDR514C-like C-terminal domain-containing protein n=1 Tax=Neurospora tetrasperma (strain FGSC 2508 / ATCC MYA-4615 / P0657) TaxID=510951 RepID=F8MGV9_NEUT8|nr:uncharacterized protein NEUTE1DRAFT_135779 [Neurospora tetrasperma FGSC 2508]EGO58678.1 hypothetical protein NEUTE1DRAFT_135779 [Neurospora tetrasperma FGSC 2508]
MYSSDSDFLDSDNEVVAPRNGGSKTTAAPPPVYSFDELQVFKESTKQAVFCAIDFETVDDHIGADLQKMSEIGVAIYDLRDSSSSPETTTNTCTSTSNTILEDLAKSTTAIHLLVEEWKHETETTCKAFWHRDRTKKAGVPHTSTILGRDQSIEKLKAILQSLTSQNLTSAERENGDQRQVRLLFWDSGLEDRIFRQAGINLHELGSDIQAWDLQAWSPFRIRLDNGKNNGQAKGEEAFASLGVLGATDHVGNPTTILHNATNDTVAQLLAFLRFEVLKSGEWMAWFDDRINLSPISFDWLDESIYQDNISRAPGNQRRHQPRKRMQGHGNHIQGKHGQSLDAKQSSSWKEPLHGGNYNRQNGTPGSSNI